ncbi:hypothetical protein RJT34_27158 [Clitoria ternatea]|uniref:Uncharacterized protein n=1 Tax=Clitoria ternatea TaxID=43366 RepID=A0AAN9IBY3_CLITE
MSPRRHHYGDHYRTKLCAGYFSDEFKLPREDEDLCLGSEMFERPCGHWMDKGGCWMRIDFGMMTVMATVCTRELGGKV